MSEKKIWTLEGPDGKRYVGSSPVGAMRTYTKANRDPVAFMQRINQEWDDMDKQKAMDDRRELAIATAVMERTIEETVIKGYYDPRSQINLGAIIASIPFEEWVQP